MLKITIIVANRINIIKNKLQNFNVCNYINLTKNFRITLLLLLTWLHSHLFSHCFTISIFLWYCISSKVINTHLFRKFTLPRTTKKIFINSHNNKFGMLLVVLPFEFHKDNNFCHGKKIACIHN